MYNTVPYELYKIFIWSTVNVTNKDKDKHEVWN